MFSRKIKQHGFFKKFFEDFGFPCVIMSNSDKDAIFNIFDKGKSATAIFPSDYWGGATPYQIGEFHKRRRRVKIIIINMIDCTKERGCQFINYGATSYVNFLCGREEFYFGLKEISKGRTFISSDVRPFIGAKAHFVSLSPAEIEVLRQQYQGKGNEQIAELLHISKNTVIKHKQNSIDRLKAGNIREAVFFAIQLGLIDPYEKDYFPSQIMNK